MALPSSAAGQINLSRDSQKRMAFSLKKLAVYLGTLRDANVLDASQLARDAVYLLLKPFSNSLLELFWSEL